MMVLTVVCVVLGVLSVALNAWIFLRENQDRVRLTHDEARLDDDERQLKENATMHVGRNPSLDWRYADESDYRCP